MSIFVNGMYNGNAVLKTNANDIRKAPALRAILNGIAISTRPSIMRVQKEYLTRVEIAYIIVKAYSEAETLPIIIEIILVNPDKNFSLDIIPFTHPRNISSCDLKNIEAFIYDKKKAQFPPSKLCRASENLTTDEIQNSSIIV